MITPPTARFTFGHPAHFIALGFGTGLAPVAPGTLGTLLAFPLFMLLDRWLDTPELLAVIAAFFAIGVWACGRTGRDLGVADHGAMNWDEVVAMMLILMIVPEECMKGGLGVMFDDIVAAFYTLLLVAAVKRLLF